MEHGSTENKYVQEPIGLNKALWVEQTRAQKAPISHFERVIGTFPLEGYPHEFWTSTNATFECTRCKYTVVSGTPEPMIAQLHIPGRVAPNGLTSSLSTKTHIGVYPEAYCSTACRDYAAEHDARFSDCGRNVRQLNERYDSEIKGRDVFAKTVMPQHHWFQPPFLAPFAEGQTISPQSQPQPQAHTDSNNQPLPADERFFGDPTVWVQSLVELYQVLPTIHTNDPEEIRKAKQNWTIDKQRQEWLDVHNQPFTRRVPFIPPEVQYYTIDVAVCVHVQGPLPHPSFVDDLQRMIGPHFEVPLDAGCFTSVGLVRSNDALKTRWLHDLPNHSPAYPPTTQQSEFAVLLEQQQQQESTNTSRRNVGAAARQRDMPERKHQKSASAAASSSDWSQSLRWKEFAATILEHRKMMERTDTVQCTHCARALSDEHKHAIYTIAKGRKTQLRDYIRIPLRYMSQEQDHLKRFPQSLCVFCTPECFRAFLRQFHTFFRMTEMEQSIEYLWTQLFGHTRPTAVGIPWLAMQRCAGPTGVSDAFVSWMIKNNYCSQITLTIKYPDMYRPLTATSMQKHIQFGRATVGKSPMDVLRMLMGDNAWDPDDETATSSIANDRSIFDPNSFASPAGMLTNSEIEVGFNIQPCVPPVPPVLERNKPIPPMPVDPTIACADRPSTAWSRTITSFPVTDDTPSTTTSTSAIAAATTTTTTTTTVHQRSVMNGTRTGLLKPKADGKTTSHNTINTAVELEEAEPVEVAFEEEVEELEEQEEVEDEDEGERDEGLANEEEDENDDEDERDAAQEEGAEDDDAEDEEVEEEEEDNAYDEDTI